MAAAPCPQSLGSMVSWASFYSVILAMLFVFVFAFAFAFAFVFVFVFVFRFPKMADAFCPRAH